MTRFVVQNKYHAYSDAQHWGPWVPGAVVDLDDDRAAWVNRDVPGTLVAEAVPAEPDDKQEPETPEPAEAGEAEAPAEEKKPAQNRKHNPGRTRG